MSRIRILVVDDHPIVRSGITSVLATQSDLEVVGEAENGSEAITAAARLEPDLVLMDLRMPVLNGVAASAAILAARPATRIVVLTTYASDGEVLRAIEAGAVGYLLKDVPHEELFRALRAVAKGARYLAQAESDCALTPLQALHLPHCAGATRRAKGAEPANRPQPPRCASRSPRLAHKSAEQTRKPQVSGPTHPIHGPLPPRQCALRGKVAFQILMRNGRLAGAVWMVAQTPRALAREDSQ